MKITIYSTPACGYCRMAKQFLTEHNLAYEDIDVQADEAEAEEMIDISGQMGVPVIVVDSGVGEPEVMVGFQQAKLKEILNIN